MDSIEQFLWKKLKLPINQEKSEVVRCMQHAFLGYMFYGYKTPRLRIAPKSMSRVKTKIRQSLPRWRGMRLQQVIKELNQMLQGWIVYFRLADGKGHLEELEAWILRHLRKIHWRQWKKPRTRFDKLLSFGVNRKKAARAAWGRSGPWFSAATSAMNFALNRTYFANLGWLGLVNMYNKFKINVKFV